MKGAKSHIAKNDTKTVDAYIGGFPPRTQKMLKQLRDIIQATAPQAKESISYGMPYYSYNGRLAYFAAFKNHVGFYMIPSTLKGFAKEIKHYKTSKSTLRFPIGEAIPVTLIQAIVKARVKENKAHTKKS